MQLLRPTTTPKLRRETLRLTLTASTRMEMEMETHRHTVRLS